ncbi:hypothetical protein E2C01_047357 [Portunus trituberculatus]|uniref:Uncharacterized protein n=1 Tax=Portunus trituberculatus TaxID=210409 RepID=A0A5B7GA98_PORTR|nr:hypothetical protein [Portunus trituberculatus]
MRARHGNVLPLLEGTRMPHGAPSGPLDGLGHTAHHLGDRIVGSSVFSFLSATYFASVRPMQYGISPSISFPCPTMAGLTCTGGLRVCLQTLWSWATQGTHIPATCLGSDLASGLQSGWWGADV